MFSGFHELINLPDIPFPFYSLRCILGKFEVILLLPLHSSQDRVVFWANWCDRGEWMGKRKSGIWHLAVITALWPRLVECWVGHINNKPTAEPLWLADDVLHSHHPSQTGDLWREWISLLKLVAVHRENTSFILTQRLQLPFQKRMKIDCIKILMVVNEPKSLGVSFFFVFSLITNVPDDAILLTSVFIQRLHINHCTATIMNYYHFLRDTWLSFVILRCTHKHNQVKAFTHAHTLTYTCI